ncbi:hypothetical protein C8R46DRAFT_935275 [Mycena filopes]|nr:hypothetical protein C8R46DRAFT_935275 [Mycena filopes]
MPRAPFDDTSADTILRSSDGVDFHVRRAVLALTSSFFTDMFAIPQPEADPLADIVPIIAVEESSVILEKLLGTWYPGVVGLVAFDNLDQLGRVIELSVLKYDIQFAVPILRRYLQDQVDEDAVTVYVIACRYGWKELAQKAATRCLKLTLPSIVLHASANPHLRHISADLYRTLLLYHHRSSEVAGSFGTELVFTTRWERRPERASDLDSTPRLPRLNPNPHFHIASSSPTIKPFVLSKTALVDTSATTGSVKACVLEYVERAKVALKEAPRANITSWTFLAPTLAKLTTCSNGSAFDEFTGFIENEYLPKLNEALERVPLELDF